MALYERYIYAELLRAYLLVNLMLLGLFGFFDLSVQLDDVGKGAYTSLDAIRFTLKQLPQRWLELTPFAALLTTVIALGLMASRRELIALTSATISPMRITASVLKAGGALLVLVVSVQFYIAPPLAQQAEGMRARALAGGVTGGGDGFWLRARDGVIHIGGLRQGHIPLDMDIYQYGTNRNLRLYLHASNADIVAPGRWRLHDVTRKRFGDGGPRTQRHDTLIWQPSLYPQQIQLLNRSPQSLSPLALYRYTHYLRAQQQDAQRIRVALWQKLAMPFTTLAMILLAAPLTFANPRGVHLGVRVTAGAALGLIAYALVQSAAEIALLFGSSPPLFMLVPAVAFAGAAIFWLRRLI